MTEVQCVWAAGAILGEGPLWDEDDETLYWVDIKGCKIHRLSEDHSQKTSWTLPVEVGAVARRKNSGMLVAALRRGFAWVELARYGRVIIDQIGNPEEEDFRNRFNDGKTDATGRFWAGTLHDPETEPLGALYRLDPDGKISRHDQGYIVTNGPAFSPDGKLLLVNDSCNRRTYAHDLAPDGSLSNKRLFKEYEAADGYPDGMTFDSEGHLWVAMWGGAQVLRLDPTGAIVQKIAMPVSQPTSVAFGGFELDKLYITSAAIGRDLATEPLAGGLFCCQPGVKGIAAPRYVG